MSQEGDREALRKELIEAILPVEMAASKGLCHPDHKHIGLFSRMVQYIDNTRATPVVNRDEVREAFVLTDEVMSEAFGRYSWNGDDLAAVQKIVQAALAAVAESDEWKAKEQEIERLKRQVSVLRAAIQEPIACLGRDYWSDKIATWVRRNETLAAADKIGEE